MWRNPAFRISWMSYLWSLCFRIPGRDRQLKSPCSSVSLIEPQLTRRQPQSCDSLSHCTLSSSTRKSPGASYRVHVWNPGRVRQWKRTGNLPIMRLMRKLTGHIDHIEKCGIFTYFQYVFRSSLYCLFSEVWMRCVRKKIQLLLEFLKVLFFLGPAIFLLYINYLPDDVICNIVIYVDETTLYYEWDQTSDL